MNKMFEKSEWIWHSKEFGENEYCEFCDRFVWNGKSTVINLSVRGDYTLFVNGKFADANQYGDFAHYKVYDSIDITDFLTDGENEISILVCYFGKTGRRYFTEIPGLIYEVLQDGNVAATSGKATLSAKSVSYESGGHIHQISPQLGYSFKYDSTKGDVTYSSSVVMGEKGDFYSRPNKKLVLKPLVKGTVTKTEKSYLVDFGEEYVGLCTFSINSDVVQNINIAYGEILKDGHVKRIIHNRDFSFDYVAKQGNNTYTNYMLRLACRYIEIECESPVDIEYVGIIPQVYPWVEGKAPKLDELDKKIYDICVNTLDLCMMEHYVDCPWREQCLYAFDSRNQMLCGYYAYGDKNIEYARSNLKLMSQDNRDAKLLSICFPSGDDRDIPSFSLYYIVAVNEYLMHSNDVTLGEEVFGKITDILDVFVSNGKDGLLNKFSDIKHWNFYDWSTYMEGKLFNPDTDNPDFMVNAIGVYALDNYAKICEKTGKENKFEGLKETIIKNAREKFYNPKTRTFFVENIDEKPTELANSFAIISGIAEGDLAKELAQRIADNEFLPCSFSMKCFKYDALLIVDDNYKDAILAEIRTAYKKMLDEGSTTVWETAEGAAAFDHAGSLCHGWSAIPVYYYHKFFGKGE